MKRKIGIALAVLVVVGCAAPSAARSTKERTETREYLLPGAIGASTDAPGLVTGDVDFEPGSATAVKIQVQDQVSPNVLFGLTQNDRFLGAFCAATPQPVKVEPHTTLHVALFTGPCETAPSFVTTGTVSVTFLSK